MLFSNIIKNACCPLKYLKMRVFYTRVREKNGNVSYKSTFAFVA